VDLHRPGIDVRLERREVVRKRGKLEGHGSPLSMTKTALERLNPMAILGHPRAVSSAGRAGDS
jgi:hypothetical protein